MLGLSQSEAAKRADIFIDTWRGWEQGRYLPTDFVSIAKLFRLFGDDAWPIVELLGIKRSDFETIFPERASAPPPLTLLEQPKIVVVRAAEWEPVAEAGDQQFVYHAMPLLRDPAAAGPARSVDGRDVEGWCLIHGSQIAGSKPGHILCLRLRGKSMEPVMPDGSIVAVDTSRNQPGARRSLPFLVDMEGDVTVKLVRRLGQAKLEITAHNIQEWPRRELPWAAVEIRAAVVWWWASVA